MATIEQDAFYYCKSLTSVFISDSVIDIRDGAFRQCDKLVDISYAGMKAQWEKIRIAEGWRIKSSISVIHCSDGDIELK